MEDTVSICLGSMTFPLVAAISFTDGMLQRGAVAFGPGISLLY